MAGADEDVPRAEKLAVWLSVAVLALAVLALHSEVLLGGKIYHMDDAADGYYPSHVAILRAYASGHLPTWDRGAWCGWPLAADPYYGPFYPLTALFALAGAARGLGFEAGLHSLLGALGMFALLRRRRLGLGPALLGAASLGLSAFMVVRVRHIIFVELMAWLPWVLYGVESWLVRRQRRDLVVTAAATGMLLLCGGLPLLLFAVLVTMGYAVPRLWRAEKRGQAMWGLAAAATVGGLFGAAQLLPTLAHLPLSPRSLGTDFAFASSYAWPNASYLATLFAPNVFGGEERGQWFGAFNHWEMAGYYAGIWIMILMPLGLARARKRPELWALFAVGVMAVILAFGDGLPLHAFFFRHLPLYGALRCPTRALMMALVAWPILAAEGLELLTGWWRAAPQRPVIIAMAAPMACLVAGAVGTYLVWHVRVLPITPPPELVVRQSLGHLLAVVSLGAAVLIGGRVGLLSARNAGLGLATLTLLELIVLGRGWIQPKDADFAEGTDRFRAVEWLAAETKKEPSPSRFLPAAAGPFRLHNVGMTYDLESAGGYDSVTSWRNVHYLYVLNHGGPYPHPQLKDDLAAGTAKQVGPLVDLMNVRWWIGPSPPGPRWIQRFRPQPGQKPRARFEPVWDAQLGVYENPDVLPRAFMVYNATVELAGDAAVAKALTKLDPRQQALLEEIPDPKPIGDGRAYTAAKIVVAQRQKLVIEVDATAPGILVTSESYYPGWRVFVDGAERPLLHADYAFRGVALTPGHHTVEMRFVSRPARTGLLLAALGLVGLVALGLLRRRPHNGKSM